MASRKKGWHFNAQNTSAKQIEAFSIQEMATTLESKTPHLWSMLGHLLSSNTVWERHRQNHQDRTDAAASPNVQPDSWSDENEYWANNLEGGVFGLESMFAPNAGGDEHKGEGGPNAEGKTEGTKCQRRSSERTTVLQHIVSVELQHIVSVELQHIVSVELQHIVSVELSYDTHLMLSFTQEAHCIDINSPYEHQSKMQSRCFCYWALLSLNIGA
jgi:hypothetical protein